MAGRYQVPGWLQQRWPGRRQPAADTAESSQDIGYADKARHKYWHFFNAPISPDGTPVARPPEPNAAMQIARFTAALAAHSGVGAEVLSYDLVWLIHLVGDIHQPLHVTNRFTEATPGGDDGATKVIVVPTCSGCKPLSLHAFWDTVLTPADHDLAAVFRDGGRPAQAGSEARVDSDETAWIREGVGRRQPMPMRRRPSGTVRGPFILTPALRAGGARRGAAEGGAGGSAAGATAEQRLQVVFGDGHCRTTIMSSFPAAEGPKQADPAD